MSKSHLIGINLDVGEVEELAEILGCSVGEWPIPYLGLPLGGNPRGRNFWEPVVRKVAKRLDGWKRPFLSKGGRVTLIQSVLAALPTYYMSIFRMPIGVQEEIEKLMRDFLWQNLEGDQSRHLVAWEEVCKPKELGGLGLVNLGEKNSAPLSKWLWRFPLEKDALWHKFIIAKYGLLDNNWDPASARSSTFRSPWKSIQTAANMFYSRTKWVLGYGTIIRFWEDE